jgi:REP element-mobilizing transposase RayT
MSDPSGPSPGRIPYNPGIKKLVEGKREWTKPPISSPRDQGFKGWHERGYLPHRDEPGLVQFVTFHLTDSFPIKLRTEWAHLLKIEKNTERREQHHRYLNLGRGECLLRNSRIGAIMDGAIRFHHNKSYELRAWVIMPNHVHVLFRSLENPMGRIIGNWKTYTAREVNKLLARQGPVWAADYWDTYMRDEDQEQTVRSYIENNPAKAKLVVDPKDWQWSSARWRDEFERLVI